MEWNAEKIHLPFNGVGVFNSEEWNAEKIRRGCGGMVRKERGIVRKETGGPSGMLRKFPVARCGRSLGDKGLNIQNLHLFGFSEFHCSVH
jgi:hypothetical protein